MSVNLFCNNVLRHLLGNKLAPFLPNWKRLWHKSSDNSSHGSKNCIVSNLRKVCRVPFYLFDRRGDVICPDGNTRNRQSGQGLSPEKFSATSGVEGRQTTTYDKGSKQVSRTLIWKKNFQVVKEL